jgi:hypothetical protein
LSELAVHGAIPKIGDVLKHAYLNNVASGWDVILMALKQNFRIKPVGVRGSPNQVFCGRYYCVNHFKKSF